MVTQENIAGTPGHQLYTLENAFLRVQITNFGCMLKSLIYKPLERETVLGLINPADDLRQTFYLGNLIGRTGNRIAYGRFELDGQVFRLPVNNGPHHLHGGNQGFDRKIFEGKIEGESLVLSYRSPDGEEGYPGNLELEARYHLDGPELIIDLSALSDRDTLFDATQHTYFNLNADHRDSIRNHQMVLASDTMYTIDTSGCTCAQTLKTAGTPFDFRKPTRLSLCLDSKHPQIRLNRGLDNYFLKDHLTDPWFGTLSVGDLSLEIHTSHPGAHVYSGNYLEPLDALDQTPFLQMNGGICFETQHIPNSINFDRVKAPILRAGCPASSRTVYRFKEGVPR